MPSIASGAYAIAFAGGCILWRRAQRQRAVPQAEHEGEIKKGLIVSPSVQIHLEEATRNDEDGGYFCFSRISFICCMNIALVASGVAETPEDITGVSFFGINKKEGIDCIPKTAASSCST
jgi:hypothetical protein